MDEESSEEETREPSKKKNKHREKRDKRKHNSREPDSNREPLARNRVADQQNNPRSDPRSDQREDDSVHSDSESRPKEVDHAAVIGDPTLSSNKSSGKKKRQAAVSKEFKTSLMTNIKSGVFRRKKVIMGPTELRQVCHAVLDRISMSMYDKATKEGKDAREKWINKHAHTVLSVVNEHRNYVQGRLRKEWEKWMNDHDGNAPDLEDLLRCLTRDVDLTKAEDHELFQAYVTEFLPRATGHTIFWGPDQYKNETISGSFMAGTKAENVPANTEALLLFLCESNGARWTKMKQIKDQYNYMKPRRKAQVLTKPRDGIDMTVDGVILDNPGYIGCYGPSYRTKYTLSDQGQQSYVGWTDEGKARYKELIQICEEARKSEEGQAVEEEFLSKLQADMGIKVGNDLDKKKHANRDKALERVREMDDIVIPMPD